MLPDEGAKPRKKGAEVRGATPKQKKMRVTSIKARNLDPTTIKLKMPPQLVVVSPDELDQLKIDPLYQRPENRNMVNILVAALEAGGKVADPITVAVRPDGSKFIVDGQQRWAAHYLSQKPLSALLYHVESLEDEKRLFSILNTNVRPHPNVRIRAWTGPSADLLNYLQESPESPVRQGIGFGQGGGYHLGATVLVNGLLAVLGDTYGAGNTNTAEGMMRGLDLIVRDLGPKVCRKQAQFYGLLLRQVFGDSQSIRRLSAVALGFACFVRWEASRKAGTTPPMPSKQDLYKLQRMNWGNWAPNQRTQWLPLLKSEILKRWQ